MPKRATRARQFYTIKAQGNRKQNNGHVKVRGSNICASYSVNLALVQFAQQQAQLRYPVFAVG